MKKSSVLCLFAIAMCMQACADSVDAEKDAKLYQSCTHNNAVFQCLKSQLCGEGVCVNQTERNCGKYGNACGQFETCKLQNPDTAESTQDYRFACLCTDEKLCSGGECCIDGCKDTANDAANCGACGNVCKTNMRCVAGKCAANCPSSTTACDAENGGIECIQTSVDPDNCGKCGNACPDKDNPELNLSDSYCSESKCHIVCKPGYFDSDGKAENGCELAEKACGNGRLDPGELCDGEAFAVARKCETFNGAGSEALDEIKCNDTCDGIAEGSCSKPDIDTKKCGNGSIDAGEECDYNSAEALPTCADKLGTGATGTVSCSQSCKLDTSACAVCGNGSIETGEECDAASFPNNSDACADYDPDAYVAGSLACQNCKISTSNCTEKCTENAKRCSASADAGIETCKNGSFQSEKCPAGKPVCAELQGVPTCVQCAQNSNCDGSQTCQNYQCASSSQPQTFSDDFSWITNKESTDYAEELNLNNAYSPAGYKISVKARPNLTISGSTGNCTVSGKHGIVFKDKSSIAVSDFSGGLATVSLEYKSYDTSAKVTVSCSNGNKNTDTQTADDQKNCTATELKTLSFALNDDACSSFTVKSDKRIAFYSLTWTTISQ